MMSCTPCRAFLARRCQIRQQRQLVCRLRLEPGLYSTTGEQTATGGSEPAVAQPTSKLVVTTRAASRTRGSER